MTTVHRAALHPGCERANRVERLTNMTMCRADSRIEVAATQEGIQKTIMHDV